MPGTKRGLKGFRVVRFVGVRFAGHDDGAEEKNDTCRYVVDGNLHDVFVGSEVKALCM